jgi:hypothetical protein
MFFSTSLCFTFFSEIVLRAMKSISKPGFKESSHVRKLSLINRRALFLCTLFPTFLLAKKACLLYSKLFLTKNNTRYCPPPDLPFLKRRSKSFLFRSISFFSMTGDSYRRHGASSGENLSPFRSSALQHVSTILRLHSFTKSVLLFSLPFFRLICHLHKLHSFFLSGI